MILQYILMFLENNRKIWSERCSKFKYFFCKNLENNKIPNFWEMECLLFGKIFPTTWIILYPFAFDRYHGKLFFFSESCLNSLHWTLNKYAREFLDDRSAADLLASLGFWAGLLLRRIELQSRPSELSSSLSFFTGSCKDETTSQRYKHW